MSQLFWGVSHPLYTISAKVCFDEIPPCTGHFNRPCQWRSHAGKRCLPPFPPKKLRVLRRPLEAPLWGLFYPFACDFVTKLVELQEEKAEPHRFSEQSLHRLHPCISAPRTLVPMCLHPPNPCRACFKSPRNLLTPIMCVTLFLTNSILNSLHEVLVLVSLRTGVSFMQFTHKLVHLFTSFTCNCIRYFPHFVRSSLRSLNYKK